MADYKKMYYRLFNRVTDALCELEKNKYETARELLKEAQRETEEMYIESEAGLLQNGGRSKLRPYIVY